MEHRFVGPLTLIHVITVLWEAREVDDAKVTAACRETVRRRLSDIIPACPDKLSGAIGRMLHYIPRLLMRGAPWHTTVVIS